MNFLQIRRPRTYPRDRAKFAFATAADTTNNRKVSYGQISDSHIPMRRGKQGIKIMKNRIVNLVLLLTGCLAVSSAQGDPPVVYLHYDYMGQSPQGYDLQPNPDGIRRMIKAFREHGIQLVVDPQHTVLPYYPYLCFGPSQHIFEPSVNFFDLKAQYFHPAGNQPWHYAIVGDFGLDTGSRFAGGYAELPGYNFMVTIGPELTCPADEQDPSLPHIDLCQNFVVGTLMHELGHNLNLRHGGDEDENFKPNYLSVMNYLWQVYGIFVSSQPGNADPTNIVALRLDYSGYVLPPLNELHLDERIGLGGPLNSTDVGAFLASGSSQYSLIPVAAAPFDWNLNGLIEPDVQMEVNAYGGGVLSARLHGFNDWAYLQQYLNTPAYRTGNVPRGPPVP
jgi:hypothetical protein